MDFSQIDKAVLLSFAGSILVAGVAGLWLKHYLADWRFTPVLVLAVTLAVMLAINAAVGADWIDVAIFAVLGATVETFGYEALTNIAGRYGVGNRSDDALEQQALKTLADKGYEVRQ